MTRLVDADDKSMMKSCNLARDNVRNFAVAGGRFVRCLFNVASLQRWAVGPSNVTQEWMVLHDSAH